MLISIFFFSSCLDEVELETETEEQKIVVDGVFSDKLEKQVIKLRYSTFVENQQFSPVIDVKVAVEDDMGNTIEFTEEKPGDYSAMAQAQKDRRYRLKIERDGQYDAVSNFQSVPNSFPLDSVSIVDSLTVFIDENGKRSTFNAVHFFSHGSAQNVASDLLLRYNIETAYQVSEITCSPFHVPKECYLLNDERPQSVELLEINMTQSPFSFKQHLMFRKNDYWFGEIFAIHAELLSYNEKEYEYWQNLKALFEQDGNLTDITPGRLLSNITRSDGIEVFGQFAVVGKSSITRSIRSSDFGRTIQPFCGVPGFRPWPLPDACCSCTLLNGASADKPDFWEF